MKLKWSYKQSWQILQTSETFLSKFHEIAGENPEALVGYTEISLGYDSVWAAALALEEADRRLGNLGTEYISWWIKLPLFRKIILFCLYMYVYSILITWCVRTYAYKNKACENCSSKNNERNNTLVSNIWLLSNA